MSDIWHMYKLQKPQNDTQTLFIMKEKKNQKIKSPLIITFQGGSEFKNVSKLWTRPRNHVFIIFRRFIRSRQSSGSASKLAFFEAFPL